MTPEQKYAEADRLEAQAKKLREEAREMRRQALLQKPLLERLVFAAHSRCPCGAGLAYDPTGEVGRIEDSPFNGPNAWDCSAILLGTAIESGQPGAVQHTGKLPFAFYEVKSENQPSAGGQTTRPK
jgi:hypothetical protein